ncbi:uncharacterized protein F5147DRAFT_658878 [Suillus discolor]|uniref:Uncharacterized protein n=1 Tax=Suillus discolor TaxID=1912936 RepID=A0A9P7JLU5_9AGAM|nr:uncharacterized protein F5147DRAFT_658878 [Suillus discolor]KAG2087689.1 hypothetical protein F5147DRAFT_658878 [Suillus discolor]
MSDSDGLKNHRLNNMNVPSWCMPAAIYLGYRGPIHKRGVPTKVLVLDNLGALQSYGHSSFEERVLGCSPGCRISYASIEHPLLVAGLAYTTTNKLIARLAVKAQNQMQNSSHWNSLIHFHMKPAECDLFPNIDIKLLSSTQIKPFSSTSIRIRHQKTRMDYIPGMNCDEPSYDQYTWRKLVRDKQAMIRAISAASKRSGRHEYPAERGPRNGQKTVAHAICNMLKRPMLDVRVNDIPYLADLVIEGNALVVVDYADVVFHELRMPRESRMHPCDALRIRVARMYLSVALGVDDEQQALLKPFSAAIEFPDLDLAARRQRWLQLFGRDDLVSTISSSKHAPIPTTGTENELNNATCNVIK